MNSTNIEKNKIPNPEADIIDTPLYNAYHIDKNNYKEILRLEFYSKTVDCFCHKCKKNSTFQRVNIKLPIIDNPVGTFEYDISSEIEKEQSILNNIAFCFLAVGGYEYRNKPQEMYALDDHNFVLDFECTRCKSQKISFFYIVENNKLIKIGQYPSISDLERKEISKYEKLLGSGYADEFNKAIRLFANGLGIASFVYLRRIFEYVIDTYHEEAKKKAGWNEEEYCKSRVEEKILLLKNYSPENLVENKKVYSVLSKGIHELSEKECLNYFNPIKLVIEIILDQVISEKEKKKKEGEARNNLSKIIGEIKTKSS